MAEIRGEAGVGLSYRPRASYDEIAILLIAACRSREVREEVCRHFDPEYLNPGEAEFGVLLDAIRQIAPSHADAEDLPHLDLEKAALKSATIYGFKPGEPEWESILGGPSTPGETPGLVHRAYMSLDRGSFTKDAVLDILRRLLEERGVQDGLRRRLLGVGDVSIEDFGAILDGLQARHRSISSIGVQRVAGASVAARWDDHEGRVDRDRGRDLLGLETGIPGLDARTLGLRGVMLVGARPGGGKTALAVHAAVGVCERHAANDAVCLFVTLEMDADKILARVKAHLSGLDWAVYRRGSTRRDGWVEGTKFDAADLARLREGEQRMGDGQVGRRLFLVDRAELGASWDAATVVRMAEEAKAAAGASRVLVVVDHLQYIPAAPPARGERRSDLDVDKLRMGVVRDIARGLKTVDDPDPAVFLIAQSRKPPTSKDAWGTSLSEFLGSVESAFAADAGLLLHYATPAEVAEHYDPRLAPAGKGARQERERRGTEHGEFLETLARSGISPIVANLDKAREGMTPGKWAMEFDFRRFRFHEVDESRLEASRTGRDDGGTTASAAAARSAATPARLSRMRDVLHSSPGSSRTRLAKEAGQSNTVAGDVLDALIGMGEVVADGGARGMTYRLVDGTRNSVLGATL